MKSGPRTRSRSEQLPDPHPQGRARGRDDADVPRPPPGSATGDGSSAISFSAQAMASLVGVPVTALASMLGRMNEFVMSWTLFARRSRPPVGVILDPLVLERRVLGIGLQHRMVLKVRVDREVEGGA